MAAKVSKLNALHELTATILAAEIEGYRARTEPVPAAVIAVAVKFLKDNNIVGEEDNEDLKKLKKTFGDNVLNFPFNPQAETA